MSAGARAWQVARWRAYPPARVVWRRPDAPADLDVPRRPVPAVPADEAWLVHEAMTNLLVGLHRHLRGERLSALRLVQVHAVDRVVELADLGATARAPRQDVFAGERGVEARHDLHDLPLEAMAPGYGRDAGAARAVLDWLQEHSAEHVDPALLAAVEALVEEVGRA